MNMIEAHDLASERQVMLNKAMNRASLPVNFSAFVKEYPVGVGRLMEL